MAELTPYPVLSTPSPMSNTTEFSIAVSTVSLMGKALPAKGTTAIACGITLPTGFGIYGAWKFTHISPLDGKWTRMHFADPVSDADRIIVDTSAIDIAPPYSRQVHTPFSGADVRAISDLMPTCLITPTYPSLGDAYGTIVGMNKAENYGLWGGWVLHKIGGDDTSQHTRLYFKPVEDGTTISRTLSPYKEQIYWPYVLHHLTVVPVSGYVTYPTDFQILSIYEDYSWTHIGGMYLTKVTVEEYWKDSAFTIDTAADTMVEDVISYDLAFIKNTLHSCLHGSVTIPAVTTTETNPYYQLLDIDAVNWPATPETNWANKVIKVETGIHEETGLHWKRVHTAIVPT